MSLLTRYIPRDSSFISTRFLFLNLSFWFFVSSNNFLPCHYYFIIYFYLGSSIIVCLFSGDINLSISISFSFVSELFFGENFEGLVILSAILFPVKWPVISALFLIALFRPWIDSRFGSIVDR